MNKNFVLIMVIMIMLFCVITKVNGATPTPPAIPSHTFCSIGETDGLLYSNDWKFEFKLECPGGKIINNICTEQPKSSIGPKLEPVYKINIAHGNVTICPPQGCSGDELDAWFTVTGNSTSKAADNLFNHSNYINLYSSGSNGIYSNDGLKSLLSTGKCPNYVYVGSSKSKGKIAFIFSSQKIDNPGKIFNDAGYTISFEDQDGGDNLVEVNDENYKKQVQLMKDNMQKFKDGKWGEEYNEECSKFSSFGGIVLGENFVIEYYEKYKNEVLSQNSSYDISEGEKVLAEYKSFECAPEPDDSVLPIKLKGMTCNSLFKKVSGEYNTTHKILSGTLKFMQYLSIILALVLSIIDFVKVIPTQNKDSLTKSAINAAKRLGIAIIIFFVPIILDFVLDIVGITDATCGLL